MNNCKINAIAKVYTFLALLTMFRFVDMFLTAIAGRIAWT